MPNGNVGMTRLRELQELLRYVREDLHIEVKEWLNLTQGEDSANMAQAILALANHGGGFIVIGFTLSQGTYNVANGRPQNFQDYNYTQDTINGIVQRYADPSFHCELHIVGHPETGELFPIVVVPGGHTIPIRARRSGTNERHVRVDTYYIRRPGPQSAPPQTSREWDDLITRCVRANRDGLLNDLRIILSGYGELQVAHPEEDRERMELDTWVNQSWERFRSLVGQRFTEQPDPYRHGTYTVAYSVLEEIPTLGVEGLRDILQEIAGDETGWPPWWCPTREAIRPYVVDNAVECWIGEAGFWGDPAHIDFWRASTAGMLFLVRGYEEDGGHGGLEAGTIFDLTLPIWRIGECLLHAERFAARIGRPAATILFRVTWTGLANRRLEVWANPRRSRSTVRRIARQDAVTTQISVPAESITAGLTGYVNDLTRPLYLLFDFYEPARAIYIEELRRMRTRGA